MCSDGFDNHTANAICRSTPALKLDSYLHSDIVTVYCFRSERFCSFTWFEGFGGRDETVLKEVSDITLEVEMRPF